VWSVVLPTARTGILTAVVLGVARAVGETAPLLFTIFGNQVMNANPLHGPQESLPLFVWTNVKSSYQSRITLAYTAALVLVGIVLFLFTLARVLGGTRSTGRVRRSGRKQVAT
jgi:phosphate transport system permease protein